VAPSWMVGVSASFNLPLHHKVQKFSSGTGSPGLSLKKGHVNWKCHHSVQRVWFPIHLLYKLYILRHFWDTASHLSKFANFSLPQVYLAPQLVVTDWNFIKMFGFIKRVPRLLCSIVFMMLMSLTCDRRMDRHTAIPYAALAQRRTVKIWQVYSLHFTHSSLMLKKYLSTCSQTPLLSFVVIITEVCWYVTSASQNK